MLVHLGYQKTYWYIVKTQAKCTLPVLWMNIHFAPNGGQHSNTKVCKQPADQHLPARGQRVGVPGLQWQPHPWHAAGWRICIQGHTQLAAAEYYLSRRD